MAHTYTKLLSHLVFSTKHRLPQIDADVMRELYPYLGGIVRELGGAPYLINGTADHLHALVSLPPTLAISEALGKLKANSSKWVHRRWPARPFAWQTGYPAFSVSHGIVRDVERYIARQEEHHRQVTFQEELLALLRSHGVDYDERYLWD